MPAIPEAHLLGVVTVAPTAQGFVLPVFLAPQHSNAYLVQVLASTREVEGFSDLVDDEAVVKLDLEESSNVGGEAIWAFQISQGHFVISKASNFRAKLFDELKRSKASLNPYVQWEVERLFGPNEKRRAAVRKLHAEMMRWNTKWADYWLSTLFILPTIRQEIERIALPNTNDGIEKDIKSLRIECSSKGVLLRPGPTFLQWVSANTAIFRTAMQAAVNEWRGTPIGTRWTLSSSEKLEESPAPKGLVKQPQSDVEKRVTPPIFGSAQILFDKSWSSYERALGTNLIDEIARRMLPGNFETFVERIVTKSPPRAIAAYAARNSPPKSKRASSIAQARHIGPKLTILCGGDYRFLLGIFRRTPRSVQLRSSDTNILLFRTKEEAEETLTKLESLTSQTHKVSQVWITEPQLSREQLELRYFSAPALRDPKSIGYLSPPRTLFSMAKYLPELRSKDFFLVVANSETLSEANIIARSLVTAKPDPGGNGVDVVVCLVGGMHGRQSGTNSSLPGIHTIVVDMPPAQLLQKARAIFSALGPPSAGLFASTRAPLVFVITNGRRAGATSFAASMMGAVTTEIYPASPLEKQNHTNVQRALRRATEELRHARVTRRRQVACQGLYHAVKLLQDAPKNT